LRRVASPTQAQIDGEGRAKGAKGRVKIRCLGATRHAKAVLAAEMAKLMGMLHFPPSIWR
jgi:hypothetical protein